MRLLGPQFEAFLAVVKNKTVHGAADDIHLTQTGITQRIRTLEKRLSTSLFVRSRRGMLLTKEGEALLRYCQQVEQLEGEALSSITGTGTEKIVSIGITGPTTMIHSRITPPCIKVAKKYPNLLLKFDINDNENCVNSLRKGDNQLAIIEHGYLSDEMEHKILRPELYVLVASANWKKRRLQEVIKNERIIDFDERDKMSFNYLKQFHLFDDANKDRHFANETSTLALMITNELGYSVLPLEFAKPYINNRHLIVLNAGKTYSYSQALAWFPRHQQPKYFSALIKACE
jgi:LysR family transcriptional regulator (chromosome initiation inhibitor)